jgi:hypothetical protein
MDSLLRSYWSYSHKEISGLHWVWSAVRCRQCWTSTFLYILLRPNVYNLNLHITGNCSQKAHSRGPFSVLYIQVWLHISNSEYEPRSWRRVLDWFMVFNATFNNISVISWRSVLLVEETGVPEENHRSVASHWQTLSHEEDHVIWLIGSLIGIKHYTVI